MPNINVIGSLIMFLKLMDSQSVTPKQVIKE